MNDYNYVYTHEGDNEEELLGRAENIDNTVNQLQKDIAMISQKLTDLSKAPRGCSSDVLPKLEASVKLLYESIEDEDTRAQRRQEMKDGIISSVSANLRGSVSKEVLEQMRWVREATVRANKDVLDGTRRAIIGALQKHQEVVMRRTKGVWMSNFTFYAWLLVVIYSFLFGAIGLLRIYRYYDNIWLIILPLISLVLLSSWGAYRGYRHLLIWIEKRRCKREGRGYIGPED